MADPVRDFKSTEDGEWYITNGDFGTVAGAAAVPQGIRIRLRMFLGEVWLDESIGVDYFDSILIKNPDPLIVRAECTRQIKATPDVVNVVGAQLVLDSATRRASIQYQCDTVYSEESIIEQARIR